MADVNTNLKYLSFNETIPLTNGFYSANSTTYIQNKPDGSKLRYCNGVFTYQPNEFSNEWAMTLEEAEKFVTDFENLNRPGWRNIALQMRENLREYKTLYPEIRIDYMAIELPSKPVKIYFRKEEITITQLTANKPRELPTGEINTDEIIISRWMKIEDETKIKNLKEDIRKCITTIKLSLKPTDKNYGLLKNTLDRLFIKYMELYG